MQRLVMPLDASLESGFSIGICAADRAANLENLLKTIESEPFPGLVLKKIVLVASACDPNALAFARRLASSDKRLVLIEEPERRGKAEAINQIIDNYDGRFLVLINSDALPQRGAISELLRIIEKDAGIGMISASPYIGEKEGLTGALSQLLWEVHNELLRKLNHGNLNNRCCDELLALRAEALHKLPPDTVNDGAYLAGKANLAGYNIRFCETAKVEIDVPQTFVDVIRQRRRIVYGHFQIWKSVGESPRTMESMLVDNPLLSLGILVRTLARSPRLVLALPVALIGEAVSVILAMYDNLASTRKHTMWDRFGSRS